MSSSLALSRVIKVFAVCTNRCFFHKLLALVELALLVALHLCLRLKLICLSVNYSGRMCFLVVRPEILLVLNAHPLNRDAILLHALQILWLIKEITKVLKVVFHVFDDFGW